jgi:hypothetical protein
MSILSLGKKHIYLIAIAVLVLLALFYLQEDINKVSLDFLQGKPQSIAAQLSCSKRKLLESGLLQAHKKTNDQIRLLIHFSEKPSQDVKEYFASQGVVLHVETWILDYAVAETTVSRLCFLADLPGITSISLGE